MNSDLLQGFYLGDLLVDPLKGQLAGQSGPVHLPPKAMEVLLVLASHPGSLVTRDELLEEVWGEGQGSQEALSHAISEIRHALDDHADDPRFIQTLPKRGYRLIPSVSSAKLHTESVVIGMQADSQVTQLGIFENLKRRGVLETAIAYAFLGWLLIQVADIVFAQLLLPAWTGTFVTILILAGFPIAIALSWFLEYRDGNAILHELSPRDSVRRRFTRTYVSVVGALAIAAVGVFIYDQNVGLPEAPAPVITENPHLPPVSENSIAVLPFLNVDGSEVTQIFANGLTDDVITRLSRVPGLLVSSRGDAFTLEPNTASRKVRERLRVAHYLEGSVQIADDQIRVIVQMIDSATGFHIMSRRFDQDREDFFAIRNAITELTVANVRVALPADIQAITPLAAEDPLLDVYILYRRGVEQANQPTQLASVDAALEWYDAALDLDPEYAAAHAGKCSVLVEAYPETDNPEFIDLAQDSCASALSLNPNLDMVHSALGDLYNATGRYTDAERAYDRALEINPKSVSAMTGLGNTYTLLNQPDSAENILRQAIGLQPGNWFAYNALGQFLFRYGRYEEAVVEYEHVVALDQNNFLGYSNLGTANLLIGNFEAAASALQRAIEIGPKANTFSSLGLMLYYLGRLEESIAAHRNAVEMEPNDHLNWSNLGDALWHAGETDEARIAFSNAERLVADAVSVNPNDANNLMDLAWINAMLDRSASAIDLIDRARSLAPDDPYVHYIDGLIRLRAGNTDMALESLERAADMGYSLEMMAAEPHLQPISADPRFQEIVK